MLQSCILINLTLIVLEILEILKGHIFVKYLRCELKNVVLSFTGKWFLLKRDLEGM